MRRVWTLLLILALLGAVTSWFWLPSRAGVGLCLVAALVAAVSLQFVRRQ
jgi:uncharacterized membrane protein